MKVSVILNMLLGLGLVWVLISFAAAGGSAATDRQLREVAEARSTALMATVVTLKPTPRPCVLLVSGRC